MHTMSVATSLLVSGYRYHNKCTHIGKSMREDSRVWPQKEMGDRKMSDIGPISVLRSCG